MYKEYLGNSFWTFFFSEVLAQAVVGAESAEKSIALRLSQRWRAIPHLARGERIVLTEMLCFVILCLFDTCTLVAQWPSGPDEQNFRNVNLQLIFYAICESYQMLTARFWKRGVSLKAKQHMHSPERQSVGPRSLWHLKRLHFPYLNSDGSWE